MTAINEGRSTVWKESEQQERLCGFEETGTRQRAGEARVKGKEARRRLKVEPGMGSSETDRTARLCSSPGGVYVTVWTATSLH
jgi:hypothetical protein